MAWTAQRLLGPIRDMAWLNAERARIYAACVAATWFGMIVLIIRAMHDGLDGDGHLFGGDFVSFWAASRLALIGWAADAYVPAVHYLAQLPTGTQDIAAFFYPPTFLLVCVPLGLLDYFPALGVFLAVTGAAYLFTIVRILRCGWALVAALAAPAVILNLIAGQNGFLTAAILGNGL